VLMVYKVDENVGVGATMQASVDDAIATKINHGFVVLLLGPNGQIKSTDYYQRPVNADPRASMELGPIERTAGGTISFYATERTSDGVYPVLCTIRDGRVTFAKNEKGNIAARHIYYDSDQQIVSYFGSVKDPNDPRIKVRTLEVLMTK
ncbi:MAG: hypothetical protein HKN76_19805, partial [Saprospiraceae bacterium]|nr:hypothetical protein [Saprospiraceae bacterium]